jgi:lysophospholipase L1-like esterase
MNGIKAWAKNFGLIAASVLVVFALSLAGDWLLGRYATRPELRGTMELIFPPRAEQTFTSVEFTYTAHINALGLRERELTPNPGVFRIAAVGDSYTYGWGVEAEQTWLRILEKNLRDLGYNVETINLGKPGSGPPAYAEIAEKTLPVVQPDLVLVGMHQGDDLAGSGPDGLEKLNRQEGGSLARLIRAVYPNITRRLRDARLARLGDTRKQEAPPQKSSAEDNRRWTENTAKDFLAKMSPEEKAKYDTLDPKVREAFTQGMFNPYMVDLALKNPRIYIMPMNLDDPWIKECIGNMAGQLSRIDKAAGDVQATVAVLSIPDGVYVNDAARQNITKVGYQIDPALMTAENADEGIRRACEQARLPFSTVSKGFVEHAAESDLFFELDGHPSPKGHALFAELITPVVERMIAPVAPRTRQ